MGQQIAKINYLKITPRKVRLIANTLKGLSIQEAEAQLLLRVQRSATPLLKLLRSAVANAKNAKLDVSKLMISSILVNKGPMLKRSLPRAMGRATPILKRMSHVVLTLAESDKVKANRFIITPPVKKSTSSKKERTKPKADEMQKEQTKDQKGFFKKMFQRKSI